MCSLLRDLTFEPVGLVIIWSKLTKLTKLTGLWKSAALALSAATAAVIKLKHEIPTETGSEDAEPQQPPLQLFQRWGASHSFMVPAWVCRVECWLGSIKRPLNFGDSPFTVLFVCLFWCSLGAQYTCVYLKLIRCVSWWQTHSWRLNHWALEHFVPPPGYYMLPPRLELICSWFCMCGKKKNKKNWMQRDSGCCS